MRIITQKTDNKKSKQTKKTKIQFVLVAVLMSMFSTVTLASTQQAAGVLLQSGLYKEEVNGELEEAIKIFERILKEYPDERSVAAQAQLHIGLCKEKLGRQEALSAYQKVVDQYPEQQEIVKAAKDRIDELSRTLKDTAQQPTFRKIEFASKPQNGVLSPDGNKLAFISNGALWTVPLHGKVGPDIAGEPVRIAEVPGIWDAGNLLAWSADGKWIAVNAWPDKEDTAVVVPVAGGEPHVVQLPERGGHAWSHRLAISPDGQMIAVSALKLGTRQQVPESLARYIYTIPTAGGEPKQVSSGWGRMPSFSPDGKFIAYVGYQERSDQAENTDKGLRHDYAGDLWIVPSSGGTPKKLTAVDGRLRGPVWSPDGKYIAAHHEPLGGNDSDEVWVFPLSPDVSRAGEPVKIALPRNSSHILAGWTPGNELGVFMESKTHEAIYTVNASGGRAVQVTPEGRPYYPRWSPDGKRIYFMWFFGKRNTGRLSDLSAGRDMVAYVPAMGGDPVGVPILSEQGLGITIPGGGYGISPNGKRFVVSAAQGPWDPQKGLDVWTIPVDGGPTTRLTNDTSFEGYPCWSPDGRWVAFVDSHMKSENESFNAIYIIPSEGGEIRQVSSESDKVGGGAIAFSPDGERIAFFSEGSIKTIPVEGGQAKVLVSKVKSNRQSQLAYSPDGSKIAHSAAGKIWITSFDGGEPQELSTGLPKDTRLEDFGWSPDGEKIAFVGIIGGEPEFCLISNFLPKTEPKGVAVRQVWSGPLVSGLLGEPSPDGRYLSYVDWETGDLAVYEIATAKKHRLTNKGSWDESKESALESRWSPDGTQIAYAWETDSGSVELRMVGLDGSDPQILYSLDEQTRWIELCDWFPDGRSLLAHRTKKDGTDQIVQVSTADGSLRVFKTVGKNCLGHVVFSPDGQYMAYDVKQGGDEQPSNHDIHLVSTDGTHEVPLIEHPADDTVLGWAPDGKNILFASDRTGSAGIWLIGVNKGSPQGEPKFLRSGSLAPLGFTPDGSFYYGVSQFSSYVYVATLDSETGKITELPRKATLRYEGRAIVSAYSPDGKYLAYACELPFVARRTHNSALLCISSLESGRERQFPVDLQLYTGFEPRWSPDCGTILIGGKDPSSRYGLFRIHAKSGDIQSVVMRSGHENEIDAYDWAHDGKSVFYSYTNGQILLRNLKNGQTKEICPPSPRRIRSQISVSPDGTRLALFIRQPEDETRYIEVISTAGGEKRELLKFEKGDAIGGSVTWTADGKNILFAAKARERNDWELCQIPAKGGAVQKLGPDGTWWGWMNCLSAHPDGRRIAFRSSGPTPGRGEVWVMENFLPEVTTSK